MQTLPAWLTNVYDLSLFWEWWDWTFPQCHTGSALRSQPTHQQMHLTNTPPDAPFFSRYSKIQGISYPTSGTSAPVLFFSLIFLLHVFWSVSVQWVLRGINHDFHSIQSSSHPESGLAFCHIQWLRRVQSKLQRWMQRFLKSPGTTSSFLQGSTVGTSRGALQLRVVPDPSWVTHLGWFVPPTPQAHPWPWLCPATSIQCFHYVLKFLFYMRSPFWTRANGACITFSNFSFRSSICAFWT